MSRLLRECPISPTADLTEFVNREQRLPRLGDAQAPWQFRGWLLPYVIRLHSMIPAVADRWGYHLRTLEAGRLPDEPIPHITFGPPDNKVFSLLRDWSKLIGRDCGGWSDFRMLLDWLSWGLSLTSGMPDYAGARSDAAHNPGKSNRCQALSGVVIISPTPSVRERSNG